MKWLEKIQAPRYLRYFFYIAYTWYRNHKDERADAHFSALLVVSAPHTLILFIFSTIRLFIYNDYYKSISEINFIIITLVTIMIHYYLLIYKNKYKIIIKEFQHLKRKQRIKGTIILLTYAFCFLFLTLLPMILKAMFDIDLIDR